MERDIARSGYRASRFADDFRVACSDYSNALAALEIADHSARELGLVLNELKTSTPGRDRYERSLTAARDREQQLFADLEVEELQEPDASEYAEVETEEDNRVDFLLEEADFDEGDIDTGVEREASLGPVSSEQLMAAAKVIDLWVAEEEVGTETP